VPEVFGRRDFRLLLTGQAVSVMGDRMVSVALAFAVLELGGSASAVGLVLAAAMLPFAATVLAGGVVADRLSRRRVMIAADLVRVATWGAMATLLVTGVAEVWALAVLAGVAGAATGFFNPASTGLLPEVVPAEEIQQANALRSAANSGSEIAGPLLAGLIVAGAGAGWAIAVDAATFGVSAVCLTLLRVPERAAREATSFLADLRAGWTAFVARRWVVAFVAYFAIGNMLWAAWSALGPVYADRELGGAGPWGVVLGSIGVGAILGSVVATRIEPRRPLVVVSLCEGLFALPLAFLAANAPLAVLAFGALLCGVGLMIGMSVWESTLQRNIPGESLSRVSSYDWFASYAFYPFGLAVWGSVAAGIGLATALWLAFGLMIGSALVLLAVPDVWRLRGQPR
jgi:predicted MFS family arabinose efflux permease